MTVDNEDFDDTIVCLDTYNSDLNLVIDASRFSAYPLTSEGFAFMWSGARATYGVLSGKICFEVKVGKHLEVSHLPDDEANPHVVRVGFSVESTSMQLGEEPLSFGYGGTGKMSTNCQFKDYGVPFVENDVVMGLLNMDSDPVQIGFAKNGKFLGWASRISKSQLSGKALFPHILSKNCAFEVNFGQKDVPFFKNPEGFGDHTFIGCISLDQKVRGTRAPQKREDCEMIMMCGLPGAGKSFWAAEYCLKHPEKKYNVLGTNNIIDKMKVMGLPRKRNYAGRWEVLIQMATKCINKMFEIGSKLRRNYVLDQTNVYPTAQRRKMRNFEGFTRRAIVVVPSEEEFQKRINKRERVEGKDVPDSAVLEMKANFKLPEVGDIFDEVIFTELQREEAEKLIRTYNEEGRVAVGPPNKRFRGSKDQSPARPMQSHNSAGFERDRGFNFGGGPGPRGSWNDSMPSSPYSRDSPSRSFRGRGPPNHGGRGRPETDYGGSGDYLGRGGHHHSGYGGRGASNDYPSRGSHSGRGGYRSDFGGRGQGDYGGRGIIHDDYRDGSDYGKMGGSYDNYRSGSSYGGDRDFKESFDRPGSDFGPRGFKSERFGSAPDMDRERKPFEDSMGSTGSYMGFSSSPQGMSDGSRGDYGRSGAQGEYGRRGGSRGSGRGNFGGRSGPQGKFGGRGSSQMGFGGQGGSQSGYGRESMQSSYGGGYVDDPSPSGSYSKDMSYGYGTDSRSSSGGYSRSDREPQNSYKSASAAPQSSYGGYPERGAQGYGGGRSQMGVDSEQPKSYPSARGTQSGYSSAYGSGSSDHAFPGVQNSSRGRPGSNRSGNEKSNWSKEAGLTPSQQTGVTTQTPQLSSYSSYTTADNTGSSATDTGYSSYSTQPQSYGQSTASYQQPSQQASTYSYQQTAQQSQPSQPQTWGQSAASTTSQTQQPQAAAAAPQAWSQYYQQTPQQQQQPQYYSQYYGLPATNQGYGGT